MDTNNTKTRYESKQLISQQSLMIVNDYQNFLEEFSQTNRKLSYSNERILELQQSGTKIEISKPFIKAKNTQTSIDVQGAMQNLYPTIQTLVQTEQYVDSPCKTHVDTPKNAKSRLKAFGNLLVSIHRLQKNQVEQISSPEQLNGFKNKSQVHPLPTSNETSVNEILSNLKLIDRFIYYAEQGSQRDIQNMMKILQLDPKRYFMIFMRHVRSPSDPNHILNSFNKYGQNSLYIAAKNGHFNVIQFLLDRQANAHIKSKVYDNFYESPLEVSIRWNHIACAKTLMERSNFSNSELKSALALTQNPELRTLIKSYLDSKSIFSCCL